VGNPGTGMS